jgi:hypothetical protein
MHDVSWTSRPALRMMAVKLSFCISSVIVSKICHLPNIIAHWLCVKPSSRAVPHIELADLTRPRHFAFAPLEISAFESDVHRTDMSIVYRLGRGLACGKMLIFIANECCAGILCGTEQTSQTDPKGMSRSGGGSAGQRIPPERRNWPRVRPRAYAMMDAVLVHQLHGVTPLVDSLASSCNLLAAFYSLSTVATACSTNRAIIPSYKQVHEF